MVFVSVHLVRDVPSYVAGTVLASSVPRPSMRIKQTDATRTTTVISFGRP
jgi:hypothetical protein